MIDPLLNTPDIGATLTERSEGKGALMQTAFACDPLRGQAPRRMASPSQRCCEMGERSPKPAASVPPLDDGADRESRSDGAGEASARDARNEIGNARSDFPPSREAPRRMPGGANARSAVVPITGRSLASSSRAHRCAGYRSSGFIHGELSPQRCDDQPGRRALCHGGGSVSRRRADRL